MIAADRGYRDRDDHTTTVDAAAASAAYAARDADAHMAERAEMAHELELEARELARQDRRGWHR